MNCKYCGAELVEGKPFCPSCGKSQLEEEVKPADVTEVTPAEVLSEAEQNLPFEMDFEEADALPEKSGKSKARKIVTSVVAGIMLLSVLIGLIAGSMGGIIGSKEPTIAPTSGTVEPTEPVVIPADGDPTSPLCKASYTVSDEDAVKTADVVVATMGDRELTNGELQAYYWQEIYLFMQENGVYAEYFGLNLDMPLDQQLFNLSDIPMSWQQFFLDGAIYTWQNYQAMELMASEAGFQLPEAQETELQEEPANLSEAAQNQGFENADALIRARVGAACSEQAYMKYMRTFYTYMGYYNHYYDAVELTEEDISAFFSENEDYYTSSGITLDTFYDVDVRHVLLQPEGGETGEDGYPVFTDEAWEACRVKVEEIYNQWQQGDMSEESFAQLAMDYSADGNASTGGLYENVYEGQMVQAYNDWCFDTSRRVGDHGLVKTPYGYHIMFFCGSRNAVEVDLRGSKTEDLVNEALEKYPITVDYSLVELGEQKLF